MDSQYSVRLDLERLVFSAAHFITYGADVCERLHGHNYHVTAEVHGPMGENEYVVDFVALRNILQELVDAWDHRMLLPTSHPTIKVAVAEGEIVVTHAHRRWVFPEDDCVLLPVGNTTSELLANLLGQQLIEQLETKLSFRPSLVRLTVDECNGQAATCELQPGTVD